MFKTTGLFSKFRKTTKYDILISLHEFSIAEFSSAIEMLYAAKRQAQTDSKMALGFIRHALDEYKHTDLFRKIIAALHDPIKQDKPDIRFLPNMEISKGYIDPSRFLFDKMDLNRFSTFIGVNENSAHKLFNKLKFRFGNDRNLKISETESREIINSLEIILADEERHSKYAFEYSRKNMPNIKFKILSKWEIFNTKIRAFYASQGRINRGIAAIIYMFVIILMYPFRFAISFPIKKENDLLNPKGENLMI